MACIKSAQRAALTALAPDTPYLAAGTMSGAFDMSFSASANIEIFELDFESDSLDLPVLACVPSPDRFNRLSWSRSAAVEGDSFSLGLLAGGLNNGSVAVWNPLSMISSEGQAEDTMVALLEKHTGPVSGLEFSELTPNWLASGAEEGYIFISDLENPSESVVFPPLKQAVGSSAQAGISCLAWNPKSQHMLASTSSNGMTGLWDLRNQKPVTCLSDLNKRQCSVLQWNPGVSVELIVASDDDDSPSLRVWDIRNTKSPTRVFDHSRGVIAMAWCPHDLILMITCSKDKTVCWDTITGKEIGELQTTPNFDVQWCKWKRPGFIATSSFDGKIGVLNLESIGILASSDAVGAPEIQLFHPLQIVMRDLKRDKFFDEKIKESKLIEKNEVDAKHVRQVQILKSKLEKANEECNCADEERKKLHRVLQELKGAVRIYVRLRPTTAKSKVFECLSSEMLKVNDSERKYIFDKIFGETSSQEEIFKEIEDLVQNALDGHKVCIFAYGQSGSGKTYTMMGDETSKEASTLGIIPRSVEQICNKIKDKGCSINLSAQQIYKDIVYELLPNEKDGTTTDVDQALGQLEKALKQRTTRATILNKKSSRSHLFVKIGICGSNDEVTGELCLVDLAGSEKAGPDDTTDVAEERTKINLSLLFLGKLLRSAANKDKDFVPNVLITMLKPYLTPGSRTAVIVNVSQEQDRCSESKRAITFAEDLKKVELNLLSPQSKFKGH